MSPAAPVWSAGCHPRTSAAPQLRWLLVIVELALWLAVSVLACDLLVRPVLFGVHLGREFLSPCPAGRPPVREAVGRVLRRTAMGHVAVMVAAFLVVAVVVVAGQWSGLVLIAGAVWGVRAWRRDRRPSGR